MHAERITYTHPLQKHASGNYGQLCVSKIYKLYSLWTENPSFILNVCYHDIILIWPFVCGYSIFWNQWLYSTATDYTLCFVNRGLDSVSSLHCARVLKALAKAGHTIVCTIHQPCTFIMSLLDDIYVLCDGQCVYRGTSYNVLPYLRQFGLECPIYHNPADFCK